MSRRSIEIVSGVVLISIFASIVFGMTVHQVGLIYATQCWLVSFGLTALMAVGLNLVTPEE